MNVYIAREFISAMVVTDHSGEVFFCTFHSEDWESSESYYQIFEEDFTVLRSMEEKGQSQIAYIVYRPVDEAEGCVLHICETRVEAELWRLSLTQQGVDYRPNEMVPEDYYAL